MERKRNNHHIDGVFVLALFALYATAILIVLYLGVESYQKLVTRDEASYDRHLGTSYIAAKIHSGDEAGAVKTGGFNDPQQQDNIQTLHLYQMIEGEKYEVRIYYYQGYLMELFTLDGVEMQPEDGNQVMEASGLSLSWDEDALCIKVTDKEGETDQVTVTTRSGKEVSP